MTKITINSLLLVLSAALASCEHRNRVPQHTRDTLNRVISSSTTASVDASHTTILAPWLLPRDMTLFSFLEVMKKNKAAGNIPGIVTMANDFPDGWIRQEDMADLMQLIDSPEKCSCFMNPLSSSIPSGNATIGGYASAFVEAYKEKRKIDFGLYACPETNKQKVVALREWWAKAKRTR